MALDGDDGLFFTGPPGSGGKQMSKTPPIVRENSSVKDLIGRLNKTSDLDLHQQFDVVQPQVIYLKWGIHQETQDILRGLANGGAISADRIKPIAYVLENNEVITVLNARHDISAAKPTTIAIKTASPLSYNEGNPAIAIESLNLQTLKKINTKSPTPRKKSKIIVDKNLLADESLTNNADEVYEVETLSAPGKKLFVTFQRQDLSYILSQIRSVTNSKDGSVLPGKYRVVECDAGDPSRDKPGYIVMQDAEDKTFMIKLGPEGEFRPRTGLKANVATLIRAYSFKDSKSVASREDDSDWAKIIPNQRTLDNFRKLINSNEFKDNLDNTVRLLPCHKQGQGWVADEIPNVACNKIGYPIVGDVDVQQDFIVANIQPKWMSFVNYHEKNAIKNFTFQLLELRKELMASKVDPIIIGAVNKAILKLADFARENKSKPDNISILSEMGNISIIRAALVLGTNSNILHGNESGSPYFPEPIITVSTIDPNNPTDRIITYSEYEYLKLLHLNESIMANKLTGFNPCWFVADEQKMWRQPMATNNKNLRVAVKYTLDSKGDKHLCNNGEPLQEALNIKMWQMLLEKHLLQYKLQHGDYYKGYVETTLKNYATQLENAKGKTPIEKQALIETLKKGIAAFKAIEGNVAALNNTEALVRLGDLSSLSDNNIAKDDMLEKWIDSNYVNYNAERPHSASQP